MKALFNIMHNRFANPHQNFQNPNVRQDQYRSGLMVNPPMQGNQQPMYVQGTPTYGGVDPRYMQMQPPVYFDPNTGMMVTPVQAGNVPMQQPVYQQVGQPVAYQPPMQQPMRQNQAVMQGGNFQQVHDIAPQEGSRFKDDTPKRNQVMNTNIAAPQVPQFQPPAIVDKVETVDMS